MEMEKKREINHPFHEHPLVFVEDQSNEGQKSYCSACGDVISDPCFSCAPCNYHLHNNCALAPQTISSHPLHPQHSGFSLRERPRLDNRSGCSYIVHVNCALEDYRFYEVVERESRCEELYGSSSKSTQPSITRVVEVSEDGEATKIEHFSHEGHCMVLADKMEEETDRRCDGCMLPVSTLFYYCSESECHFYLHKNCAELPRVKRHWIDRDTATLNSRSFMWCFLCNRPCSGFFYEMGELWVCLRCAEVPDVIEFQGHEHLLFYDFKCRERCNGCGAYPSEEGAFKCGKCSFTLDFKCLSLPHSVVHKIDEHQLNLTYHDDNDYSKHLRCDICEGKRDRSLWYYCCSICDTSAHPDCILGEFPFLKDGIILPPYSRHGHRHDVRFHRKAEDYPNCSSCGQRCRREIVKCAESTCNYIAHFKCWWPGLSRFRVIQRISHFVPTASRAGKLSTRTSK
ncbi:hypothetical protein F3Y22_tig00012104pilonHSYRG00055 [Hibiscus syriacus]|uniref:Phorbol-ester/DAG-type domain-containing protein n=1 Tax=Hibiscus syriacus TaxID=106335 RepID=A0A6A3C915_HIBSY|nr:hypothetical protein F3Y22_tig00012104pilonHSYRG00055 [Hibiscus syriacus]